MSGLPGSDPDEFPKWLLDAADLLGEPDPGPTPWLVEDLIVDQAIVACVGRWKTTKSYGLLDLCISIAAEVPAFGKLPVSNRVGNVLYICEESGRAALWRRLDALCRGRAIDPEQLREGGLLVAPNMGVKLDDPRWQEELLDYTSCFSTRLIAFDPLARMKAPARNESAQNEMAGVIEFLRHLRDESKATVGFVHHTGHQGDHMRGSSDLESAWETRLLWKRDGKSPLVTIESEHREVEAGPPIRYRINWDPVTRSMRFDLEGAEKEDDLEQRVRDYLAKHPDASANEVDEQIEGTRKDVLRLVRSLKQEGGSEATRTTANHPEGGRSGKVVRPPSFTRGRTTADAENQSGSDQAEPPCVQSGCDEPREPHAFYCQAHGGSVNGHEDYDPFEHLDPDAWQAIYDSAEEARSA